MDNALIIEIRSQGGESQQRPLNEGVYSIGSDKSNKIVLAAPGIAWRHAILTLRRQEVWIEDLNSDLGTSLDGQRLTGRTAWKPGHQVIIGSYTLTLKSQSPAAAAAAAVPDSIPVPRPPKAPEPVPCDEPPPAAESKPSTRDPLLQQKRAIKAQVHRELLERLDIKRITVRIGQEDLSQRAWQILREILVDIQDQLPAGIVPEALIREIHQEALELGPLEDLLADPQITEIMVNGPSQVYVERKGLLELTERTFLNDDSVLAIIERIVAPLGRRIDESQPYVDARLKDGSRVNAIIHPLSLVGPCLTIRKFSKVPFTDADLIRFGTMTSWMAAFLRACVLLRKNIVVSGGTGSGKTSFLNVLSSYLPESDRIVTIEDAAELRLNQPHIVRLEARPANIEGKGAVTIRDLVRNALRMRPDRIIVGECRGGESLDMLQAMNTGHDGSLTTVHANTPRDVISRLETMVLMSGMDLPVRAIREQIAAAIDMIIHESRMSDGSRKIVSVTEVVGMEGDMITTQEIFAYKQTGLGADNKVQGDFVATGAVPTFLEDLSRRGIKLDLSVFSPRARAS